MRLTRRPISLGVIKNILIIILVVFEIVILTVCNNKSNQLKHTNNQLESTINYQINTIQNLTTQTEALNNRVLQLEKENSALVQENMQLIDEKAKLEEELSSINTVTQENKNDFKSYMNYTAITNRLSKQWELQKQATTNENGLRCINGVPLVAVGTGWGLDVGDYAVVYCDNGNNFDVVIGDIKADIHTMSDNKTTSANNCKCEFIVDINQLNQSVKKRGDVSVLQEYSGYVVDIKGIK